MTTFGTAKKIYFLFGKSLILEKKSKGNQLLSFCLKELSINLDQRFDNLNSLTVFSQIFMYMKRGQTQCQVSSQKEVTFIN
jgi:hypothetical protein